VADIYAFALWQMGVPEYQPAPRRSAANAR